MMRFIRSSFVIARRDFGATVLSKAFIFFLLAPVFPLLFGSLFGGIGARIAARTERPVIAVIDSRADFDRLAAARDQLAHALGEDAVVKLVHYDAEPDELLRMVTGRAGSTGLGAVLALVSNRRNCAAVGSSLPIAPVR